MLLSFRRRLSGYFLVFFEDDELVADEVPCKSGNAPDGRSDESPLVGGEASDFVEE